MYLIPFKISTTTYTNANSTTTRLNLLHDRMSNCLSYRLIPCLLRDILKHKLHEQQPPPLHQIFKSARLSRSLSSRTSPIRERLSSKVISSQLNRSHKSKTNNPPKCHPNHSTPHDPHPPPPPPPPKSRNQNRSLSPRNLHSQPLQPANPRNQRPAGKSTKERESRRRMEEDSQALLQSQIHRLVPSFICRV